MSKSSLYTALLITCALGGVGYLWRSEEGALGREVPALSSSKTATSSAPIQPAVSVQSAKIERIRKNLPNIQLYTQDNQPVRFYDDLVQGKIVLIYFMFTTCQGICPGVTANLVKVQDLLGDRFGRDIFLIGITLQAQTDTPKLLKQYAELYEVKPGWTFVTGKYEEIEKLRRKLGVYDPDPVVDADIYSHAGLLTFGNESTGRWAALPGLLKPKDIVEAVLRITRPKRERTRS